MVFVSEPKGYSVKLWHTDIAVAEIKFVPVNFVVAEQPS
jgi:hypothetical protein